LFSESNRDSVVGGAAAAEGAKRFRLRAIVLSVAGRSPFASEATTMSPNNATWNAERVDALKRYFAAGLSCSRIAHEIGVSRNAVIGKMNRLGLSRPKEARQRERAGAKRPKIPRSWAYDRPTIAAQQKMLKQAFPDAQPGEEVPIRGGRGCTLFELGQEKCRWPISTPGAADFCFCGNEPVKGLPYCPGHARVAYRPARQRSA
jgi:GcrA cell cycle regulator